MRRLQDLSLRDLDLSLRDLDLSLRDLIMVFLNLWCGRGDLNP